LLFLLHQWKKKIKTPKIHKEKKQPKTPKEKKVKTPKPKKSEVPLVPLPPLEKVPIVPGVSYASIFDTYYAHDLILWSKAHGLKTNGTKKDQIQRILAFLPIVNLENETEAQKRDRLFNFLTQLEQQKNNLIKQQIHLQKRAINSELKEKGLPPKFDDVEEEKSKKQKLNHDEQPPALPEKDQTEIGSKEEHENENEKEHMEVEEKEKRR